MSIKHIILFISFFCAPHLQAVQPAMQSDNKFCFATATDTEHYTWTLNLIGTIHQHHPRQPLEIAVFDLGLTTDERAELNRLANVKVYDVELVTPLIFQKFKTTANGKVARGWYAWKPVVLKQALEMFDEFFYLDSGISVVGPMHALFQHLHEKGHLFIDCGHSIGRMTIKPLIQKFGLAETDKKAILEQPGISAGFQGISRALDTSYVLPMYELAHNLANFADDGSCPKGFGWARHDQTLFSIQARLLHLDVNEVLNGGALKLSSNGKIRKAKLERFIKITRGTFDLNQSKKHLRYKRPPLNAGIVSNTK